MREPISLVRRTLIAAAIVALPSMPLAAQQPNSNTTSTAGVVGQDTTRRDDDRGFPWGLLGLLGLAGLLGRRREETVRTVPPSTTRPGDVGARM